VSSSITVLISLNILFIEALSEHCGEVQKVLNSFLIIGKIDISRVKITAFGNKNLIFDDN